MNNVIQYTSRTFESVLADINSDDNLVDKPVWFKNLIAGSHDVLSMYLNAITNESYLRTAFTRLAVSDLLALIDYHLAEKSTSSGSLCFYLDADNVTFPKSLAIADLAARNEGSLVVSSRKFESRASVVVSETVEGFTTDYVTNNYLTVVRVYTTGEKVRVVSDDTLPDPLAVDTDYFVVYVSDTEILLSTTLSNALKGITIVLTDDGSGNHTVELYSIIVTAYQQDTKSIQDIGTSDGSSSWQEFDLPDLDIIRDTLEIVINSVPWEVQTTLVDSDNIALHYLLRYNTDDSSYILFGDGTYGKIPENYDILATYAIGGGPLSNVTKLNSIVNYAGSDSDVVGVSNLTTFTGGSSAESIDNGKNLGPLVLKSRDRFVTSTDGEALANSYDGVAISRVIKNFYGVLSAKVPVVPSGGGTPSSVLKTGLQEYLINRTILEEPDIRVVDPTYNTVTPVVGVKVLSSYSFTDIKEYTILALRMLFYEASVEIVSEYRLNGIGSAIDVINNIWSTSFTASDYTQIASLIENLPENSFAKEFQESDVLGYLDTYVNGIDYLTWTSPAFPITQANDEITTDNVLTGNITEIT